MNLFQMWWMRQAWLEGLNFFETPYLHHPLGAELYWHTLAPIKHAWGIVLLPMLEDVAAYNFLILFTFVASAYTSWLLFRYLCREAGGSARLSSAAAFVGASIFAFSPYMHGHAYGHMNLISVEAIPLFVLLYLRYKKNGATGSAVGAGLAALYIVLSDYYLFTYILLFIALDIFWNCIKGNGVFAKRNMINIQLRRSVTIFAVALLFASPVIMALIAHAYPRPLSPFHGDSEYYIDLLNLAVPFRQSVWHWLTPDWVMNAIDNTVNTEESGAYLGWTSLLLVFIALRNRLLHATRFVWIGGIFAVLSLGGYLSIMGTQDLRIYQICILGVIVLLLCSHHIKYRWLRDVIFLLLIIGALDAMSPFTLYSKIITVQIPLPYMIFKNIVPFFDRGGMPVRFLLMAYFCMGACASLAVLHLAQTKAYGLRAAEVIVFAIMLVNMDYLSINYPMIPFAARPTEVIDKIRKEPSNVAVLTDESVLSQLEVMLHKHPISYARQSRIPIHEAEAQELKLYQTLARNKWSPYPTESEVQGMKKLIERFRYKYFIAHAPSKERTDFIVNVLGGEQLFASPTFEAYQLYK